MSDRNPTSQEIASGQQSAAAADAPSLFDMGNRDG